MTKAEISELFHRIYATNDSLEEEYFSAEQPEEYESIIEEYGDWSEALRKNGITPKKNRENKRFWLYTVMKRRYEKHGMDALQPKTIDPDLKIQIHSEFKTLAALRDLIVSKTEKSVLYDVRMLLLTGSKIDEIKLTNPELYERMIVHFGTPENFLNVYRNHFGIGTIRKSEVMKEKGLPLDIVNMAIAAGFMQQKDVEDLIQANKLTREDTIEFLRDAVSEEKNLKNLKNDNPSMFYAIQSIYGGVQEGINFIMQKVSNE